MAPYASQGADMLNQMIEIRNEILNEISNMRNFVRRQAQKQDEE